MSDIIVVHGIPDLRRRAGGIAGAIKALDPALAARGIESRFMANYADPVDASDGRIVKLRRTPIGLGREILHYLQNARDEARRLDKLLVCHSHGLWNSLNHAFALAAVNARLPLVVSPHGMLLPWARSHKRFRKDVAWRLYQFRDLNSADQIHATSKEELSFVRSAGIDPPGTIIPFGVEAPAIYRHGRSSPLSVRTLLFLGRLHPIKNLECLLDAFADVSPPGWRLALVGPDEEDHRTRLLAKIAFLGIAGSVTVEGPVFGSAKHELLSEVDALVLPSHSENYGSVVAEALIHGLPVIASRGTPWSQLQQIGCGWWVEPTVEGLAGAVSALTETSPEELSLMGGRGHTYAAKNLTWATCALEFAELYEKVGSATSKHFLQKDQ